MSDSPLIDAPLTDGRRFRRPIWLAAGVVVVALLVFVLVWFQPHKLVVDDTVSEPLPGLDPDAAGAIGAAPATTMAAAEDTAAAAVPTTAVPTTGVPTTAVPDHRGAPGNDGHDGRGPGRAVCPAPSTSPRRPVRHRSPPPASSSRSTTGRAARRSSWRSPTAA